MKSMLIGTVLLVAAVQPGFAQPVVKPLTCDRVCLEGYVDRYLDAMLAHTVHDEAQ